MEDEGIFSGLKVLDFTWAAAGPIITKHLADNGATVIKVESASHPDSIRLGAPFKDGVPGINRSGFFADFNSSKLGIAVNMNLDEGRDLIKRLAAWADIIAENFRPGILERWGIGYKDIRAINEDIIFVSSSLYGADGPWSHLSGFGAQGQAVAGIHGMTGWPDCPPASPKGAYTDSVSPRYALAALVAALIYRDRTGLGQQIEISQIETTIPFLGAEFLEYQLTGVERGRHANTKEGRRLHGVFPCQGEDYWIAIDVRTDSEWESLLRTLEAFGPLGVLQGVSGLDAVTSREAVEAAVSSLTSEVDPFELMDRLQRASVPAGVVLKGSDLLRDPVFAARHHFWELDHPEMGTVGYNGPGYRFEKTPSVLTRAAPCLGEHTDQVLRDVLSLDPSEIEELRSHGVLE